MYTTQATFHPFSRLPTEIRDAIWQYAFALPSPGMHVFEVDKIPEPMPPCDVIVPARSVRLRSIGSYSNTEQRQRQQQQLQPLNLSNRSKLGLRVPAIRTIGRHVYSHGGPSKYLDNYGVLNACRQSRDAALWCAEFLLGDSHIPLYIPGQRAADAASCITVDAAQDLVCLRPQWAKLEPRGCSSSRYRLDLLRALRGGKAGRGVTSLAVEWSDVLTTGYEKERIAATAFFRRRKIHPFLLEMLAHLKRETFVEVDYPPFPEGDEEEEEDNNNDDDDDDDDDDNSNEYDYEDSEDGEIELFEANHPFNRHHELKGKFYLIDYRIKLQHRWLLKHLEYEREPEFVCGRKKFYKVAMGDRFFDVGPSGTPVFSFLYDLERAALKNEYGDVPVDMASWPTNPMDSFRGTVGCSMYALACIER